MLMRIPHRQALKLCVPDGLSLLIGLLTQLQELEGGRESILLLAPTIELCESLAFLIVKVYRQTYILRCLFKIIKYL